MNSYVEDPMSRLTLFTMLFLSLFGCKENDSPVSKADQQLSNGNVAFTFDKVNAPAAVQTITAALSRTGFETISKTINIHSDTSAMILFEEVAIGTWHVKVDAKDDGGKVLYAGEADVTVMEGTVSRVNLALSPVASGIGSVQITVTWGDVLPEWKDYLNNPVLPNDSNQFESGGVSQPHIVKVGGQYFMYYQMIGTISRIGLAISYDGITWVRHSTTPVINPDNGLWDAGGVVPGPVYKNGAEYIMLYQGYSHSEGRHFVGVAKSNDKIVWSKPANNRIAINGVYPFHASDVIIKDSLYFMYYTNFSDLRVNLAISHNGLNWGKYGSGPVLQSSYPWENGGVYYASVVKDGNKYLMIYSSYGYSTCNFGLATSSDGKNWIKNSGPIFSYDKTGNPWAPGGISYPVITVVGDQIRFYYSGYTAGIPSIGFAYFDK